MHRLEGEYVPGFFGVGQGYTLYDILDLKELAIRKYGKVGLEKKHIMSRDSKAASSSREEEAQKGECERV
jgi:hypothetical protein